LVSPLRLAFWIASVAGIFFGARALVGLPAPVAVVAAGFGVLGALGTLGTLAPGLGLFGVVHTRGPAGRREVALTFDDGPNPTSTPRVLALLAEHGAKATFFVVGEKALAYPELVRAIADAGHGVGVHGHVHDRLYALRSARFVERDLARAVAAVRSVLGFRPTLFRPPVGFVSGPIAVSAERAALTLVGWSARSLDGRAHATPARVLARATRALENGAIVLLHDAAERDDHEPACLAILGELLTRLRDRGLTAVTVDALRRPL
jgi:peptidoglycan/xylan/chitin deacetylase (PgdA/CDA1 family)